jgi:Tol biopolymer transport system component
LAFDRQPASRTRARMSMCVGASFASRRLRAATRRTATVAVVRRALALAVLILLTSACGSEEMEQSSDGTDACTADLTQVIGPNPELREPTWSPDRRRIAFSAGDVRRTSIYAVTVADCALVRLGPRINLHVGALDWSSANVIAFDATAPGGTEEGIYTMTAGGGDVRRVTDGQDHFPEWSPDGTRIAFARGGYAEATDDDPSPAYANRNIWVIGSDGSGLRQVTDGRWHGSAGWSPDGVRLVTDTEPGVVELGVDGSGRRVLLEGEYSHPSWSPDGDVLLVSAGPLGLAEGGQPPVESLDTPGAQSPEWSPDGEWIAFADGENEADVWIVRPDGTGLRQLTTVR